MARVKQFLLLGATPGLQHQHKQQERGIAFTGSAERPTRIWMYDAVRIVCITGTYKGIHNTIPYPPQRVLVGASTP